MIGRKLSHFRILERLGQGGMGVVYRAEDEKLRRVVALKVLPADRLADEGRRLRFVREARTAAAVTHSSIAVVHEIDEAEGVVFIAMELVEGRTLGAAIGGRPMSPREALRLAVEIAEGLAAAHRARVIHRDLKPANIMVTPDGRAKVLDFGLAKLLQEREPAGPSEASGMPTVSGEMTQAGSVLGTTAYMSPEQARGLPVDARSDLFSFGVVLYEMVTGRAPFAGATAMDVMSAILSREAPPASMMNAQVPAELDRIIGKCLEKDARDRYQDSRDLVVDLRRLKRDTESPRLNRAGASGPPPATSLPRRATRMPRLAWSAAALVIAGAAAVTGWKLLPRQENFQERIQRQLTANPADNPVLDAGISPDGHYLAYTDASGIHVSQIDTGETHPLPLPEGFEVSGFVWKHDGTALLVQASESRGQPAELWSLSIMGGPPRKLFARPVLPSPDGNWLLEGATEEGRPVIRISGMAGGPPRTVLTAPEGQTISPAGWSPTSRRFAYYEFPSRPSLETCDRQGRECREITSDLRLFLGVGFGGFAWLRDGRAIYGLAESPPNEFDRNLWEVRVDPDSGRRLGAPRRLTNWTDAEAIVKGATDDGRNLAVLRRRLHTEIHLADLESGGAVLRNPRRFTSSAFGATRPLWTRDGEALIFVSRKGADWGLFKRRLDSSEDEPVVSGTLTPDRAVLSPEGSWVVYLGAETLEGLFESTGERSIMKAHVAGGPPELVQRLEGEGYWVVECPDRPGASCVLGEHRAARTTFYALDLDRGRGRELASLDTGEPLTRGPWSLSPDGSTVAVPGPPGSPNGIAVVDLDDGRRRDLVVHEAAEVQFVDWDPTGDALFVSGSRPDGAWALMRTGLSGKTAILLETEGPAQVWMGRVAVSPDGRHLAFAVMTQEASVWLLENF